MHGRNKARYFMFTIFILIIISVPSHIFAESSFKPDSNKVMEIEQFVNSRIKSAGIPGMSIVVTKDNEIIYSNNAGYADKNKKVPIKGDTLFELGTSSLTFTSYGILLLEKSGVIGLDDNIQKYIPWFKATYKGKETDITIRQILYFTGGISDKIEGLGMEAGNDGFFEKYVRKISGMKLDNEPGRAYKYCPSSYNILCMVIEKATDKKYADFIQEKVLKPLNLNKTFLSIEDTGNMVMSDGYKAGFGSLRKYEPARNISGVNYVSCMDDFSKWLLTQVFPADSMTESIINKSRSINSTVNVNPDGSAFAMGWKVYQSGGVIINFGNTPSFSSFIGYRPDEKVGIAVLANVNSAIVQNIGTGVLDIINGSTPADISDTNRNTDKTAIVVLIISGLLCILFMVFFIFAIFEVITGKRKFRWNGFGSLTVILMAAVFATILGICVKYIPAVLFKGMSWNYIMLWQPPSVPAAIYSVTLAILIFIVYYLFTLFFRNPSDKSYFTVIILSASSGLGYTFVMYIITQALSADADTRNNLIFFFIFALALYVYCQKVIRTTLINLTNNTVHEKRIELIEKIMRTPYHRIENIELSKIHNSLNHDMDVICGSIGNAITAITSLISIVCLFIYLGIMSIFGLIFSIVFIAIAFSIQSFSESITSKIWEHARDIQNSFVKFINNLVYGFKELSLHRKMRTDFKEDVICISRDYRDNRTKAEHMTANSLVLGQILIYMVVGSIIFLLPLIFKDIQKSTLSNYVFVFLFLVSPLVSLFDCMPKITQMKVSWKKIKDIEEQLDAGEVVKPDDIIGLNNADLTIRMKDVEFSYANNDGGDKVFSVGPLNCEFKSGEITFITGGNGSGKSTLAKLLTGLYCYKSGSILINDRPVESDKLGEYFSVVFSDYYLFDKLYGIDFEDRKDIIEKNLKVLQISDKLKIVDGALSTTRLSSGQRKRLALMICYADNRPVYLFDEWAADQDPEFRKFFYNTLLPEMKAKGKCVIAITHDDRYYNVADRIIKMETGMIIKDTVNMPLVSSN